MCERMSELNLEGLICAMYIEFDCKSMQIQLCENLPRTLERDHRVKNQG